MRASPSFALVLAVSLLAGCSKGASGGGAEQSTASAPPPAAEPTPDQAKAMVAALPAPFNTGDLVNGEAKVAQCRSCHTLEQGGPNMTGPNLWGIFGRKAGSVADFNYSDGLKAAGWTWDAQHIDTWITDPRAVIPTTRMTFFGLKDPKDRIDAIAYLKVHTSPPGS